MNNKKLIPLILCWISAITLGLYVSSLAGTESGTNTEAEQHFEKANELRKLADYDAAITEYKKVISLSPNSKIAQDAQYWIGQSYFESRQFDAALSAFEKIIDDYPASTIIPSTKLMIERVQRAKNTKSLFEVVEKGDIEQVKKLISEGGDINVKDENGHTALHLAVINGNKTLVELLIAKGADIEAQNRKKQTPLTVAIKTLGEQNFKMKTKKYAKGIPSHEYLRTAKEIVSLLIDNGADVNAKTEFDLRPLHIAAMEALPDVVELLIAKGADVNGHSAGSRTPLHMTANFGINANHSKVVEILIDNGADPLAKSDQGWTPLDEAINVNRKEIIKVLVAKGATDIPETHLVTYLGNMEKLRSLIEKEENINKKDKLGKTFLTYAAIGGNLDIVRFLLSKGADINAVSEDGMTPLTYAAFRMHKAVTEELITNGADLSVSSVNWGTPLHAACFPFGSNPDRDKEIVMLLIDKGADINACHEQYGTPLHVAVMERQTELVKLLIEKGADVNAKGGYGCGGGTPLHMAIFVFGENVLEPLIDRGADVNAKDDDGATPLHLAVQMYYSRGPLVEPLLAYGADVNAKDNKNRTPLWYAKNQGRMEIIELLKKHKAKE